MLLGDAAVKRLKPGQEIYRIGSVCDSFLARIEQLAFVPIDTRLSNALLDFHEKGEDRVTHQELAVELGTAREVVSRRLKRFESEGWIRLSRGRITVSDRRGLRQLGNPRYLD